MSTRGNYNFVNRDYKQKNVMIYAHYDNYPEGAAGYIYNMLMYRRDRFDRVEYNIVTPETFLRANAQAELTDDVHGDIEYYYEIDCKFSIIRAYEVSFDDCEKMLFFEGSIFEFVNQHIDKKINHDFKRFYELSGSTENYKFTNQQQSEVILEDLYKKLGKMAKWDNYQQNPNFISALEKTKELEKTLKMMKGV